MPVKFGYSHKRYLAEVQSARDSGALGHIHAACLLLTSCKYEYGDAYRASCASCASCASYASYATDLEHPKHSALLRLLLRHRFRDWQLAAADIVAAIESGKW